MCESTMATMSRANSRVEEIDYYDNISDTTAHVQPLLAACHSTGCHQPMYDDDTTSLGPGDDPREDCCHAASTLPGIEIHGKKTGEFVIFVNGTKNNISDVTDSHGAIVSKKCVPWTMYKYLMAALLAIVVLIIVGIVFKNDGFSDGAFADKSVSDTIHSTNTSSPPLPLTSTSSSSISSNSTNNLSIPSTRTSNPLVTSTSTSSSSVSSNTANNLSEPPTSTNSPSVISTSSPSEEIDFHDIIRADADNLRNLFPCEPRPVKIKVGTAIDSTNDLLDKDFYPDVVAVMLCGQNASYCGNDYGKEGSNLCKPIKKKTKTHRVWYLSNKNKWVPKNINITEDSKCECM